ncbi:hypothetical protein [Methylopila turkensis]|uniref:Alpha/beta hydrolase n=1 Tax=Methylopila turkensis TaxID=1437816 RepID=A0A9W6JNE3_9HYPH|nr:hypothetical protein [Methylopila turkensis]GLK78904.1 hypothetical protein GCM10008174_06450 [Methylopila turkensis]
MANQVETINESVKIAHAPGAKANVVVFGGLVKRSGYSVPDFELVDEIASLPYNAIFLKDSTRRWYNLGVKGVSDSFEGTTAYIEELIEDKFGDEDLPLVTVGASMGGYAAVGIGEQLGARFALSIAPQTVISLEARTRLRDNRWKADFEFFKPRCADLRYILKGRIEKLKIVVGTENVPDIIQAANLAGARGVSIDFVKGADHDVLRAWSANGDLARIIADYIENGLTGDHELEAPETDDAGLVDAQPTTEAEALEPARN